MWCLMPFGAARYHRDDWHLGIYKQNFESRVDNESRSIKSEENCFVFAYADLSREAPHGSTRSFPTKT